MSSKVLRCKSSTLLKDLESQPCPLIALCLPAGCWVNWRRFFVTRSCWSRRSEGIRRGWVVAWGRWTSKGQASCCRSYKVGTRLLWFIPDGVVLKRRQRYPMKKKQETVSDGSGHRFITLETKHFSIPFPILAWGKRPHHYVSVLLNREWNGNNSSRCFCQAPSTKEPCPSMRVFDGENVISIEH